MPSERDGVRLDGHATITRCSVTARFVIDASGPRGFLQRLLDLARRPTRWLPPTQGLYTHFDGVARVGSPAAAGEAPPYPVDDAARASRVSRRLDLGAAVQQRHHQRRRRV